MFSQTKSKSDSKNGPSKNKVESMDVYEKLKEDHRKVEKLFKTLLDSDGKDDELRGDNFQELKELLEAHAKAEEEIFYPLTEKNEATKALTLEAYEEHKIAKTLLQEIDELQPTDEVWSAKVKVLSEAIKHHVKEEEQQLFPLAKKVISKGDAVRLGGEIQNSEQREFLNQKSDSHQQSA